jgi:hypothetical protein
VTDLYDRLLGIYGHHVTKGKFILVTVSQRNNFGMFARILHLILASGARDVEFSGSMRGRGVWLGDDVITEDSLSARNHGGQRKCVCSRVQTSSKKYFCSHVK